MKPRPEEVPEDIWEATRKLYDAVCDMEPESSRSLDLLARALLAERLKEREACAVAGGDAIIQKHPILAQMVRNAIRSSP